MQPLELIVLVLATFYFAYAVTKTHGPYKAFEWLRAKVSLGGLTACIVCLAFWVALLVWWLITSHTLTFVVYAAAGAGGAILLYRYTGGEHVS
jgi:hypothetical protein